jgi:hypothetical protein
MQASLHELHGIRVLECSPAGPLLRTEKDALDVIQEALSQRAPWIAIPMHRLDPGFFELRTRIAGEVLQKFVNYQRKVAILGDFTELAANSESLRALIYESNRGDAIWFLPDLAALETRLEPGSRPDH